MDQKLYSLFNIQQLNFGVTMDNDKLAKSFVKAGGICAIIAFLFIPPLFGILGIVFGAIAWSKGEIQGRNVVVFSVVAMIVGMVIGAMMAS